MVAQSMEIQYGKKQKEMIRFTEVPFKNKKYTHVEYLRGWSVLKEYVLTEELSDTYQKDVIHLFRKNPKIAADVNESLCKEKIRFKFMNNKREYTCFEKWSLQDKRKFKSWLTLVQGEFKSKKKPQKKLR